MNKRRSRNKKQVSLSQSLLRKKTNRETHNTNVFSSTAGNSTNFSDSNESQSSNDTQRPTRANSTSLPDADDFDDSFDLFLPRKTNFSKSSLQSSLFEVKKKSRYFNESGELKVPQVIEDDDLELAIAVSLQESKGKSVCLKPTKTTTTSQPRGRLKQAFAQSLLMRRTPEDRERIVTEKVAIVLMNTDKLPPCNTQLPDYPHSLYSTLLRKQFDEVKPLWTISQIDLSKIEPDRFYTSIIVGYTSPLPRNVVVSSSESNASGDENDSEKASNVGLKLAVSSEDIFGCSDSEAFSQCPSPKRPRNSTSNENLTAQNYGASPGNGSCNDPLVLRVEPTDLFNPDYRQKPAVDQLSQPTVRDEVVSLDHGVCQMECDDHQEPRHTSPAAKSLKQLSQLSSDLRSLSTTAISKIISIDKGFKTLYAHTGVFRARCQLLGEELERNDKCLDEYTWAVCDALFDFIYAADSSKVLKLSREEKRQMIELCSRFKIVGLHDETGVDEEISPSVTTQVSSSLSNSVTKQFISSKCESSADVEDPEVIELDSEGGTVDEGSDRPVNAGTDDEFDLHLKDGIRLLDRAPVTSSIHQGDNVFVKSDPSSPSKSELITPKRSLDKYFEDSFPSFADIKATPRKESTVDTVDAPGASKPPIINCLTPGGKLIVSEVATPLPDYASMASPELQGALQNYGIRTDIGRRKAVTLLNYIYDQIHPPRDHPAVVKALNDVARARAEQAASSESDVDIHSLSSDASDLEAFEELGDVTSTDTSVTVEPEASLLKKISCFFKRNSNLYVSILRYEPIWLNQIHRTLKEEGVKCSKKELIASLDELGITFRTEQSEKQIQRRRTRNANRRRR